MSNFTQISTLKVYTTTLVMSNLRLNFSNLST